MTMEKENTRFEEEQQELIMSEEFDRALEKGSDVRSEISGTMRERDRNNYGRFRELVLMCTPSVQDILDKPKKRRTQEEASALKEFDRRLKSQYRLLRDMMFLPEDERLNDDGTENTVPKRLLRIAETLALVHSMLRYVGCRTLDDELSRRGITVESVPLEETGEGFANERVRSGIKESLMESCAIRGQVEEAERSIREEIFEEMVPERLRFDKDSNPGGIRDSDFKKLVDVKFKLVKSEKADLSEKEKASEKAFDEAEKKTFEIQRSKTVRAGLMALGAEGSSDGQGQD